MDNGKTDLKLAVVKSDLNDANETSVWYDNIAYQIPRKFRVW